MSALGSSVALLGGCATISFIEFPNAPVGPTGLPEIDQGVTMEIFVHGQGQCDELVVNFDDQTGWLRHSTNPSATYDLANPPEIGHVYKKNLPGGTSFRSGRMTITAHGDGSNCVGEATKKIFVSPVFLLALGDSGFLPAQPSNLFRAGCTEPRDFGTEFYGAPFPQGMLIGLRVPGRNVPGDPIGAIDYPTVTADADGLSNYSLANYPNWTFPTPQFRPYSLIVIAGSQTIQGGKSFAFTIADPQVSNLQFCLNTDPGSLPLNGASGFVIEFVPDWSNVP